MKNNSAISLGSRLLLSATLAALLSAGTAPAYAQTANVPPVAAASAVQTANKLSVTFDGSASSDSDGSIASYAWNFGNGKTGTGAKPVHTYAAAGKYAVVLTVKDNAGASASTTLQVDVNAAPVARGTAVQTKNSNMVSFDAGKSTDAEGPIASYSWEFDDGGTATGATATRTYSRPGTYSTKLTVTDSVGASNTTTIKTVVNAKPVPIYQWKQFDGELIIVFAGGDSTDDDGHVTSWSWNFGGGKTASGMDVSHMYSAPGTYPVEFTVKDNSGNSASTTFNVTVVGRPNMAPEAYASATQAPNSLEVAFSSAGSRDPDGSIANYFWTFGNGKTGTGAQIRHTYEEAGAKEASLTVTDNQGTSTTTKFTVNVAALNRAPTARASAAVVAGTLKVDFVSNSTDPEGDSTIASHQWIFGDGGTASGATTSHVYGAAGPYNASLTVTDNKGASSKVDFTVNIAALPNRAPVAVASSTQTPGTLDVVFSGAGSTDEDKNIASYEWTFSDGGSASGITATHKYAAAGTYTAHLIVTDEKGAQHGVDLTVNVAAANNKLPTARIASMPVAGSLGVKFNGGGSTDEDGFIKSYAWTFGDGGTSTEASPTHTYASARTYPVSLTVTDDGGAVHTQTLNLDVKATTPTASKWVTGYYAGWYWHDYKPQVIDMSTMTHVVFGRVAPGGGTLGGEPGEIIHGGGTAHDAGELSDAGIGKSVEDHLIERAHAAGTKALLMLGGNDDGNGFVRSTTSAMRPTFVSNLLAYLVKHDYDGVDIDWEDKIETDTQIGQLIALIKDLKTAASAHPRYASQPLLVTFPTYILNLNTMTVPDWKVEVASLVDQFNIMSYEMSFPHGTWKTAHFAPLYGINRTTHPVDINSTVQEYVKKGIAPSKIGIGIGFYGSSFAPPVTGPDQPLSAQSSNDTEWSYANLVNGGFLSNGEYIWDEVAQMGYRRYTKEKGYPEGYTGHAEYNTSTSGFLSYEDPASINAKGKFVREKNLGGTILWTINYGSPDGINNPLLNAVKQSFILGSDTVQPFTRFTSGMTNSTGLSFTFDGTASTDSGNQPVVSYAWNFGDNQTALGPKPTHTYAREGTYLVSLTVTDANKVSNTMSSTVAAVPPPPPDTMPPLERVPAPNRTKPWVLGYYAGWYWDMYSPEHIDMKAMTHLVFGRVAPGGGTLGGVPGEVVLGAGTAHHPGTLGSLTTKSVEDYVIERAHAAGTKVLLMVGGMFDGNGFLKSSAPGIDHREKFVKNLLDYMELHSYDGVDLDWEDVLDSELSQFRLKALIADLRAGAKKRTRWQAPNAPFEITFPNYAMNMNYETVPKWKIEVAELVDQFNLMSYGMGYPNDGWTTTTFAPLFGQMSSRPMDISSSIKAYQDAGIPRNKLGLGIGFYGMSYAPPTTMPGQPMSTLSSDDNTWSYANLVNGGFLKDPKTYHWDDVAKMGYRSYPDGYKGTAQYNKEISGMLTYEDPRSIAAKGAWVKQTGVGGAIIWVINYGSADGVTNPLLKAVKESFLD